MAATDDADASRALRALVTADPLDPSALSALIDSLDHDQRVTAVRCLRARDQARLFAGVEGAGRLSLDDLVPDGTPALTPVRHYGMNSLPLFRVFEKRFYRFGEGENRDIGGANFQALAPLTGPGYFTVREDAERGELLVDYQRVPDAAPEGWPGIQPNERGRSRFVYGFMVDTLRRVSTHVSIGSAARHGKPMHSYFVLCREAT